MRQDLQEERKMENSELAELAVYAETNILMNSTSML